LPELRIPNIDSNFEDRIKAFLLTQIKMVKEQADNPLTLFICGISILSVVLLEQNETLAVSLRWTDSSREAEISSRRAVKPFLITYNSQL